MKTNGDYLKERGLELVESNNMEFLKAMRFNAYLIAREEGRVCADDLRPIADRLGIKPNHSSAWGAVFRGKTFKRIDYIKSVYPSNHSRPISVWVLA